MRIAELIKLNLSRCFLQVMVFTLEGFCKRTLAPRSTSGAEERRVVSGRSSRTLLGSSFISNFNRGAESELEEEPPWSVQAIESSHGKTALQSIGIVMEMLKIG